MSTVFNIWAKTHHQSGRKDGARSGKYSRQKRTLAASVAGVMFSSIVVAAPVSIVLPAQPLADALVQFAKRTGTSVVVDSALVAGKKAPALDGYWEPQEGIRRLLAGSGLYAVMEGDTILIRKGDVPKKNELVTDTVNVRAKRFHEVGPLPGLGLTKDEIPGNVQSISAREIKESHSLSVTDLMNKKLQSVNVNDYQGNPFQMDVTYRGFTASPQIGTPQGLSVFMDGIRVNEPFGDVVNWDMIPMNALSGVDVFPGSNPIFGLGTLGGAFSMKTKDGFNNAGASAEILTGSFGRKQLQVEGGWNNANKEEGSWDVGDVAVFGAGNFFLEDGWRNNSPSRVNQVFGKASYRGEKLDLNLTTLIVRTNLVGNGLIPSEMYAHDPSSVFTGPDTTKNDLLQFQLSGAFQVNDSFSITGQVYRRDSKRNQVGSDVYTEYGDQEVHRNLAPGEEYTCLFNSTNQYKLPDYYVVDLPGGDVFDFGNAFIADIAANTGVPGYVPDFDALLGTAKKNEALPAELVARALSEFNREKNFFQTNIFAAQTNAAYPGLPNGDPTAYSNSTLWGNQGLYTYNTITELSQIKAFTNPLNPDYYLQLQTAAGNFYYYTPDGTQHVLMILPPVNAATCQGDVLNNQLRVNGPQGGYQTVDGGAYAASGPGTEGVVVGTPTAVITNTDINQLTDGASIQFNWNFDHHKFMVGASIDRPTAKYKSGQRLGLMDAQRNVFLAPDQIRDEYAAADQEISNNNFDGEQTTKSIYASETWSPIESLHISGSARYNDTHGKNTIASRTYGSHVFDLSQYLAFPNYYEVCPNGVCPTSGYIVPDVARLLNPPESEKFSYYSLNPAFGVSWQAKENLNLYGNVAQGTRTPSVIELGCAFDDTPVYSTTGVYQGPKSLQENRSCSLPSTLSGDPFLPQVKAQTMEIGARGQWGENAEWNLSAYRTNLRDDIYLVTFPGNRSFFDSIGKTRRQGIEAGISAAFGKAKLRLNYALTDATFQDTFQIAGDNNSSSFETVTGNSDYGRSIQVTPGNRMPGVPLHNLNATFSYDLTPEWQISLTGVAHSMAYVRGNENNQHQTGVTMYQRTALNTLVPLRTTTNPGTVPGYMVFNFQTSYKLAPEWTLGLQVNNIFDKEYFTAGRLGRNPFSPSILGAIGPDGYNHNSTDWLSTNFLAPGAPRAAWISLSYEFQPDKK